MSSSARNQPCSCGSGKIYKKCCGGPGIGKTGRPPKSSYYRFHLSLLHSEPRIWRRFLLRADASFQDLHEAIQALGWMDSHCWLFVDTKQRKILAGPPMDDSGFGQSVPEASQVPLAKHFTKSKDRCDYEYDLGDSWLHRIVLEDVQRLTTEGIERVLLEGAEEFPYEDCGGIPGHQRMQTYWATGKDPWDDEELLHINGWDEEPLPFDLLEHKEFFDLGSGTGDAAVVQSAEKGRGVVVSGSIQADGGAEPGIERPEQPPATTTFVECFLTAEKSMQMLDDHALERIKEILGESLEKIRRELGLDAEFKSKKWTPFNSTWKLEISTVLADGLVINSHAESFLKRCEDFGLQMEDLGRSFTSGNQTLRIVGLRPRAKAPVLCERLDSLAPRDQLEAWTVENLRRCLD